MKVIIQEADGVVRATEPLQNANAKIVVESLLQSPVEACSDCQQNDFIANWGYHTFFQAAELAYVDHRPLALSPDMFWLLVTQGFANHVNLHSEEMRHYFVEHEGKKIINIQRDDFVKGSQGNPWEEVFPCFSEKICEYIGDENHSNIVVEFSTTGNVEKAANELILMESMKSYFEYSFSTACGIPEIILEGELQDWEKLRDCTEKLGRTYELQWWIDFVHPILDRIVRNVEGKDDPELWKNFYKRSGGSGGPYINGWITSLVPYIKNYRSNGIVNIKNTFYDWEDEWRLGRLKNDNLPIGLCQTPFTWNYFAEIFDMEFVAGFIGTTQNGFVLRPKIGWAIKQK